jgi:hypothetical protein
MGKKRKTRQQKIILQLKRELAKEKQKDASGNTEAEPRQEAILSQAKTRKIKKVQKKKIDNAILSYDSRLVRRDLAKTAVLAFLALSLEFVIYLRLR